MDKSLTPTAGVAPRIQNTFRMYAKKFFLTFPQCPFNCATAMAYLMKLKIPKICIVARERHQDESWHLHVFIEYENKWDIRRCDHFDLKSKAGTIYHGNYRTCRSAKAVQKYVTKGGVYQLFGITEDELRMRLVGKSVKYIEAVREMQLHEWEPDAFAQADPEFYLRHHRGIEALCAAMRRNGLKRDVIPLWIPLPRMNIAHLLYPHARAVFNAYPSWHNPGYAESTRIIYRWLCNNLDCDRPRKQKQLYIHGPPNLGKSALIERLGYFFLTYDIPNERFYDGYDNHFQLCVLDEFSGGKTIQWLNRFLDGSKFTLAKKGSQYVKVNNPPVIILSNLTLEECYAKALLYRPLCLAALKCRLEIVELEEPLFPFIEAVFPLEKPVSISDAIVVPSTPDAEIVSSVSPTPPIPSYVSMRRDYREMSSADLLATPVSPASAHLPVTPIAVSQHPTVNKAIRSFLFKRGDHRVESPKKRKRLGPRVETFFGEHATAFFTHYPYNIEQLRLVNDRHLNGGFTNSGDFKEPHMIYRMLREHEGPTQVAYKEKFFKKFSIDNQYI